MRSKQTRPLSEFESNQMIAVFTDAEELPQFFAYNLLDDARVIKVFKNDAQASLRIFYYQYLKLCFQSNPSDSSHLQKLLHLINNPQFIFIFPSTSHSSLFRHQQFKRLILQFFNDLSQSNLTINQSLSKYPIMDLVLTYFFRSILMLADKANSFDSYVEQQTIRDFLGNLFNIQVSIYQKCIRYGETDIFGYEVSADQVYLIYIEADNAQLKPPPSLPSIASRKQYRDVSKSYVKLDQIQPIEEQQQDLLYTYDQFNSKTVTSQFRKVTQIDQFSQLIQSTHSNQLNILKDLQPNLSLQEPNKNVSLSHHQINQQNINQTLQYSQNKINISLDFTNCQKPSRVSTLSPLTIQSKTYFYPSQSITQQSDYNVLSYTPSSYQPTSYVQSKPYIQSHDKEVDNEHSNSFTLEHVIEPHKSNIKAIKVRARMNRKAIQGYIY